MAHGFSSLASLSALLLLVPLVYGQPVPDDKWTSSEPHLRQGFGSAVAVRGVVAVVGAPGYDPEFNTLNYGAAYVYRYDGSQWVEEQKLTKLQPSLNERFGRSVALGLTDIRDGTSNTLLVGMLNDEDVEANAGAVYVYEHDGNAWEHAATISASDGAAGDGFSSALALIGDYNNDGIVDPLRAVVGAPQHSLTGFNREGAAYLYRDEDGSWVEEAKLTASDPSAAASFGVSVAISGDRVLIGATGNRADGVGFNAGAAYVFEYDGEQWVETAKLTASDAVSSAEFGFSIALDGDRALIGARLDSELAGGAGAAYLFRFEDGEWNEEAKLTAWDNNGFHLFGSSVALDGTQALVGSPNWAAPGGDGTGKAYHFLYDGASEQWLGGPDLEGLGGADLEPIDGGAGDHFSGGLAPALALDAGVAVVGSPDHGLPFGGNGAVYVYGKPMATSAEDPATPASDLLSVPYPNPFRERATLTLSLTDPQAVSVAVYDLLGRRVALLHEGVPSASSPLRLVWEPESAATGLYVVRAEGETFQATQRVAYIR
jgi:hypothetical protein